MTSDLTYIPFYDNWVDGLRTLLKKLVSIDTPRPLNNGRHIAASTYLTEDVIKNTSENIYLNLLSILNLPDGLKRFEIHRQLDSLEYRKLSAVWPFYKTSRSNIYSFQSPPPKLPIDITLSPSGGLAWGSFPKIDGTKTSNIISSLLLKSLYWKCHEKGLKFSEPLKLHFFPVGLLHGNKIPLVDTSNRRTYVLATSERRHRSQEKIKTWRYHLCPTFQVRQDLLDDFTIQLSTRIYITDAHGQPLAPRSSNARRKALCKSWWNYEWLNRHLAICSFLADQSNEIRIGRYTNEQIIISSQLLTLQSPYGINEEMLKGIPPHIGTHDEGLESKEEV